MTKKELCEKADVSASTIDRDIRDGFPLTPTYPDAKGFVAGRVHYSDDEANAYIEFRKGKVSPGEALAVQKKADESRQTGLVDTAIDRFLAELEKRYPVQRLLGGGESANHA